MQKARAAAAVLVVVAIVLAGCRDRPHPASDTTVLGASPPAPEPPAGPPPFTDAQGQVIPAPPAPVGIQPQLARVGDEAALAVWAQEGRVFAAAFDRARGWSPPQALEQIYGQASQPQLAGNGQGSAMAVWRHTVGSIRSLRFSRYEATTGWSPPDVLPGALPRAHPGAAPELRMDASGAATARWPSGFDAAEMQVARYVPGQGWSRATSEPMPSAPAAPPRPAASAER